MSSKNVTHVFHPFRAIGQFCDSVPFAIQKQGRAYFVACSIDKTFQVYNADKLDIVQVGGQHEDSIRALAVKKRITYTASGSDIQVWHRSTLRARFSAHRASVDHLLIFGNHLISASRSDHVLHVWNPHSSELFDTVELDDYLRVTSIMHPDTYLNKILIGTSQGELLLWNLKSNKLVYRFKGWGSAVLAIEQSNVVDVVAIGLEDGRIVMHNLKADKTLFQFEQTEGPVTALSFRTDAGFQQLVSGSKNGTLAVWNLENKQLVTVMRNVHEGPVTRAFFFQGEPLLLTSGTDNSLNIWIFDQTDGSARLLKSRSGHAAPPTKIRFCATSSTILSGGQDRSFRFFSTIRDQRSRELSQGHIQSKANNKQYLGVTGSATKLSPMVTFDFNITKQKQWDNVVSCHRGSNVAITWNKQNLVIGKYRLQSHSPTRSNITAVAISACGNYALLGAQSGFIDKYNIQSGIHRGALPDPKLIGKEEARQMRHTAEITGLAVDSVNRFAMSGALDGSLKFWNFEDGTLHKEVQLPCAITQLAIAKESSLLAVVTDDFVIHVFDIDTQVCVRRLHGHTAVITDLTFSSDGRWVVSASADASLRVWDLPTGHCVDWVIMPSPVVSLSMSPRGDFLATSHVDSRGIFLWANQNYFSNLFLQQVTSPHPVQVAMPVIEGITDGEEIMEDEDDAEAAEEEKIKARDAMDVDETGEAKEGHPAEEDDEEDDLGLFRELISLSKAPKSKWKTMLNLELINERNKPEKAAETPKAAPFFLPTLPGVRTKFLAAPEEEIELPDLKRIDMSQLKPTTPLIAALQKAVLAKPPKGTAALQAPSPFNSVAEMFKNMSPSAIDFEITSLSVENNYAEFALVLRFVLDQLQRNVNYEMAQAILNLLLKHQGGAIAIATEDEQIKSLFDAIEVAQNSSWERLQSLFHSNLCLITYFSNLQQ
jgi:U3 small nucleolar RNA-associated protein 21